MQQTLLTGDHTTTGTPAFMAPEIILGRGEVDRRADVYALGCVAYYLLTGQLVFEADTPMKMFLQHVQTPPMPPSQRTELPIPRELDELVLACLEKDPDKRPQDAEQLFEMACAAAGRATPGTTRWPRRWWETHLVELTGPLTLSRPAARGSSTRAVVDSLMRRRIDAGRRRAALPRARRESPGSIARCRSSPTCAPGEGATAVLMLANIFLLLICYSVIKTVREPLILLGGGAEVRSYAAAGQALVLMGFVPFYSWFASRVDRVKLLVGVTLFFVVNIELFALAVAARVPYVGVAFFIWVGIFNISLIAQFWSFANDIYSKEAGDRLFPIIMIGMTAGAPLGSLVAGHLFGLGFTPQVILQISAVLLLATPGALPGGQRARGAPRQRAPEAPLAAGGGFGLVLPQPVSAADRAPDRPAQRRQHDRRVPDRAPADGPCRRAGGGRSGLQHAGLHRRVLRRLSVLGQRARRSCCRRSSPRGW